MTERCLQQAAVTRNKIKDLQAVSEELDRISMTDWLMSKRESLRQSAVKRIVWRLRTENRTQA
jgi:hypothetical protein